MPDAPAGAVERRLHPLSWLFALVSAARNLVLPAIVLLATARAGNFDLFLLPAVVFIVAGALIRQWGLRYVLGDQELVIRRNFIVERSERHVPYARVHNLKTSETPLHRWLGVVEVTVETAGGSEPEAVLRVLSRDALAELRAHVARKAGGAVDGPAPGVEARPRVETVLALSVRQIVMYGLLNNRGLIVAGALLGVIVEIVASSQGDPWQPQTWVRPWSFVEKHGFNLLALARERSPLWLIASLVMAFAGLKLLSVAWALVSLYQFQVDEAPDGVVVRQGLLPRTTTVIPFARLQRIVVRERPSHRWTGTVEVLLASVGSAAEDTKRGPVWLAPIVPRVRLDALLARVGAPLPLSDVAWERLHPRAARRMQTRMAILAMPAIGLSWPALGPWSLPLATIVLGLAFAAARRQAAAFGYARSSTLVAVKRGWLWRSVYISWIDRIQAVSVQASPFDRRHGMASVLVDTAAGAGQAGSLEIPYLDAPTAVRVAHDLAVDGALSQSGVNRPAHNDHNRQTLVSLLATSGTAGTALDPPERPPA